VHVAAGAILAVGLLAACGKGTPVTTGTPTPVPYTPNVTSRYVIPTPPAESGPAGIVVGSDGNLWFTQYDASRIGELTTSGTMPTPQPITPTANAGPNGIASGPNSLLWFAETKISKIGQVTLSSTPPLLTEFAMPNAAARPFQVALGSDGNMWVTDPGTNSIWRVNQRGEFTQFPLRGNAQPYDITNGPDGALWFTEPGTNKIGRLPISGSPLTEYSIPTAHSGAAGIAAGTDNALWFTEKNSVKVGRIATTGQVTAEYSVAPAKTPDFILQGIDGNFYFTDTVGNQIGQFFFGTHTVKLFPVHTANSGPTSLTLGPDSEIYFTESTANAIGQFKYFCC
jgi:virginiamycin B lyase